MKFKLVEKFDETRNMVQEYMYDAIDELNNASLEEYIQWFMSEFTYFDDEVKQAVTDAYIEACDYGMIKGVKKTRLTSELKEYIESNTDIIDDTDDLMRHCPEHLRHELQLALDVAELNESLTGELLTEKLWFTVTHRDPTKRVKDFYLYSVDQADAEESLKHIFKLKTGNHAKQSFDKNVKDDLLKTYPNYSDLDVSSVGSKTIPPNNILSIVDRSFRREADKVVKNTNLPKALINSKIYKHHIDGNEYNQALDNLLIWENSNSSMSHMIHNLCHGTASLTSPAKDTFSTPVYRYNGTNWILYRTIDVTIR